jgi:alkylhydroperoxidase domain protein
MTELVTEYPELHRPDRFTQEGLGWVPWLAPVPEAELSDVQRDALIEPKRAGMPYFRLLARDPAALKARTLTDLDIFFNTTGGVGRAERELAAAATSRRNGCVFCASVHAAAATRESGRRDDVQRLLDDGVTADLGDARWNAVVAASVALADTPLGFAEQDLQGLRDAGFDDAEILDVLGGAAFFHWANRLMLSLGEPEVPARRAAPAAAADPAAANPGDSARTKETP